MQAHPGPGSNPGDRRDYLSRAIDTLEAKWTGLPDDGVRPPHGRVAGPNGFRDRVMQVYLGLGSNLGDRRDYLSRAIDALETKGLTIARVSPVVESPALLPDSAPADWNLPFLNLTVECVARCSPEQLRLRIDEIQREFGRHGGSHWAPRTIDIDILLWGRERIATEQLAVPHRDLTRRAFVLAPLVALEPRLTVPGLGDRTTLDHSIALGHHIPLWMGIVNVTPDSFSDGGRFLDWSRIEPHVEAMTEAGVHVIDVGGESTRPDAFPVDPAEEWSRVGPVLERLIERNAGRRLRPLLSLDTRHPEVAEKGLKLGVDIVNDVGGLTDPAMIALARGSGRDWIAMHHVTVPADPRITLSDDRDPFNAVERWLIARMEEWEAQGLDLGRIVFDPGIGFGKNRLQSLRLLKRAGEFRHHGLRVLVGHSRKSFMKSFSGAGEGEAHKDLLTLGASLGLCAQGVDVIRVHNVPLHIAAYRGWSHVAG